MTASDIEALIAELRTEFRSLDSSLIAAFLSEFHTESPTRQQLLELRQTLTELAVAVNENYNEQSISDALPCSHIDGDDSATYTSFISTDSSSQSYYTANASVSTTNSPSSCSSDVSFPYTVTSINSYKSRKTVLYRRREHSPPAAISSQELSKTPLLV